MVSEVLTALATRYPFLRRQIQ